MAKLTASAVIRREPVGDRFLQTLRATSGSAGAADEWVDFKEHGLIEIDALLGVAIIGTSPLGEVAPVAATGTVTFPATNPTETETITVGGIVYTINATPSTAGLYSVDLSDTEATLAANFAAAINRTGTPGTDYSLYVAAHPDVKAAAVAGVVTLTARVPGSHGNAITLAVAGGSTTVSGATLSGGSDGVGGHSARKNAQGTGQTEGSTPGVVGVEFSAASVVFEITAIGR